MQEFYCPQCQSAITTATDVCPQCLARLPFDTSDFLGYRIPPDGQPDFYKTAKRQRFFLIALLFLVLSNIAMGCANFQGVSLERQAQERGIEVSEIVDENPGFVLLGAVAILMQIVFIPMAIVAMFLLTRCMKYTLFSSIVLSLTLFIPLLGLIVMFVINGRATKMLQTAGYRVGLLGAAMKQFR